MYRIAVRPAHRRHGLGRTLVAEAERVLREQGARRFHMIVEPGEAPANAFWQAVGYERTDQYRYVKTVTLS
jgi:ribosomal protein S18 acetylase RimI-like enzyme